MGAGLLPESDLASDVERVTGFTGQNNGCGNEKN
jgi:hypothetical protein